MLESLQKKRKEEKEVGNILCYNFLSPLGKLKYKIREFIKKIKKIIKYLVRSYLDVCKRLDIVLII